ncbi:succinate dehydrogenase assembly factor 4, mitochondrial [Drosophila albomicans]|uniref:Succinate dehydrogenase assembly factor 4, mitochondrial n=1 Tax=Drosophila albomicans TaxID=7291 RepID=A0A6P8WII4_DROAB|nr:succinate dehydrogenase assembly factor 4, mitochondrial [Drosophila albomicans]
MISYARAINRQWRRIVNTRCNSNIGIDPLMSENIENNQLKESKEDLKPKPSERYLKFKEKLRSEAPLLCIPKGQPHPAHEKEPLKPWPNNTNPHTGEVGGPRGPEPTRYGDWESKGRVTDF